MRKVKKWIKRYVPAEIVSVALTLLSVLLTYKYSDSRITTALVGTWAGNIGYFGYIITADIIAANRQLKEENRKYSFSVFKRIVTALIIEFGIAEVIDSLIVRPFLMYQIPLWLGSLVWGSVIAKLIADITFYIPAIIGYEFSRKNIRNLIL